MLFGPWAWILRRVRLGAEHAIALTALRNAGPLPCIDRSVRPLSCFPRSL